MNKEFLLENIRATFNIAEADSEFVYGLLIKEIVTKLDVNDAIRIQGIGTFQLRKEPLPREERRHLTSSTIAEKKTLIYTPFQKTLPKDTSKLFYVIDLDEHSLGSSDDIEKYLNLSINKPLIFVDSAGDSTHKTETDTETALIERIREVVNDAEVINDFNIWEEYFKTDEDEKKDDLPDVGNSNLMSDGTKEPEAPVQKTDDQVQTTKNVIDKSEEIKSIPKDHIEKAEKAEEISKKEAMRESLRKTLARDFEIEKEREKKAKEKEKSEELKPKKRDLFAELEKYLKEDDNHAASKDKETPKETEQKVKKGQKTEPVSGHLTSTTVKEKKSYAELRGNKKFVPNKWFIIAPVILVLVILIVVFFPKGSDESQDQSKQAQAEITQPAVTPSRQPDSIGENVLGNQTPVDDAKRTGLYREIVNDQQVSDQIFYDGFKYTVQVSSWRSSTIAEREVERLKAQGHDAFIFQVFLDSKQSTWNRVRIGYFNTQDEAQAFLDRQNF